MHAVWSSIGRCQKDRPVKQGTRCGEVSWPIPRLCGMEAPKSGRKWPMASCVGVHLWCFVLCCVLGCVHHLVVVWDQNVHAVPTRWTGRLL